jgi:hypothetical protein
MPGTITVFPDAVAQPFYLGNERLAIESCKIFVHIVPLSSKIRCNRLKKEDREHACGSRSFSGAVFVRSIHDVSYK